MGSSIRIENDRLYFNGGFSVSFQRTLRIPDDGRAYPLPPGLGTFPIAPVRDFEDRVPAQWRRLGDAFIPLYQREALWLEFRCDDGRPRAVKVAVGGVNALTGTPLQGALQSEPQDYLVCPDQPWLDGINAGADKVRQFVAMPLGSGHTIEAQLTGKESVGGFQFLVFKPRPDWMAPQRHDFGMMAAAPGMGVAAGGWLTQKIYRDPYGVEIWDPASLTQAFVHVLNSLQYQSVTGKDPPATPICAATYAKYNLPWFAQYDESHEPIAASPLLQKVESVREIDERKGLPSGTDESFDIDEIRIRKIVRDT